MSTREMHVFCMSIDNIEYLFPAAVLMPALNLDYGVASSSQGSWRATANLEAGISSFPSSPAPTFAGSATTKNSTTLQMTPNTITALKHITKGEWIGYDIVTERQTISVMIEDGQLCCEDYGVDITEMDILGREVQEVKWFSTKKWRDYVYGNRHEAIVLVKTNEGPILVTAWNAHNGYYSHRYKVKWDAYQDEDFIDAL